MGTFQILYHLNETNEIFFFLQFPSSIFLVVVLYQITNLFQDPKDTFFSLNLSTTQFKM